MSRDWLPFQEGGHPLVDRGCLLGIVQDGLMARVPLGVRSIHRPVRLLAGCSRHLCVAIEHA